MHPSVTATIDVESGNLVITLAKKRVIYILHFYCSLLEFQIIPYDLACYKMPISRTLHQDSSDFVEGVE